MIKYLFIVINSLSLFIFGLFKEGDISVTSTIPATLAPGQEIAIELKVNKGAMSGFARLQLDLPEGIYIKESEDKGSNYSYENNVAKWVWAAQPSENEIVIKVVLIASENTSGAKTISAKYSYVENNNKQVAEMPAAIINVVAQGATTVATTAGSDSSSSRAGTMPMAASNSEPPGKILAERIIIKNSDTEYLITLKIKKGITKGFAKYIDDVVGQLTTRAMKTDGSSFSVADGKIKFVWVNVPEKEDLEISYTLGGNFSAPIILNGEYSYLEENQSKKYKLNPDTVRPTIIKKEEKPDTNLPEVNKKETALEEAAPAEVKKEEPAGQLSTDTPSTEKKESMMNFAVQIGAFTNANVNAGQLKQRFNINETIRSEMHGGFSKFMVGSHPEYKNAHRHRETIKNNTGIKTAFIVAYSGAKRITVQEALMATSQKWFK